MGVGGEEDGVVVEGEVVVVEEAVLGEAFGEHNCTVAFYATQPI